MSAAYPLVRNRIAFSTRIGVRTSPSRSGSSPISTSRRRMRSCIFLFYIALFFVPRASAQDDPDALYRQRATTARAREAAAIWEARLQANARDFESAWKIARAMYWLGEHHRANPRRKAPGRGVETGRIASV